MRIVIVDDYADSARHLQAFSAVAAHQVAIHHSPTTAPAQWAERLAGAEALVLIRERSTVETWRPAADVALPWRPPREVAMQQPSFAGA